MKRLGLLSLAGALSLALASPALHAQPPVAEAAAGAYDDSPDAPDDSEDASAPATPSDQAPVAPAAPDPTPAPGTAPTPAPTPAPLPASPPGTAPLAQGRGAIVVAASPAARAAARQLARVVYRDRKLRPEIAEPMAAVLTGSAPADAKDPQQAEVAALVASLATVADDTVRRRLLASLGAELGANLVVWVDMDSAAAGPRARVLRLPAGRALPVTLAAEPGAPVDGRTSWDWRDAAGILRGLVSGPPPGPRAPPTHTESQAPGVEEEGDDWAMFKSPWFWGGLGVVVTVGVTVLVLSQTALNEPDVVMLEGRVGQ